MRHRGGMPLQGAMLAAEIVVAEHQRQRGAVVIPFFREAIRQPAHSFAERAN